MTLLYFIFPFSSWFWKYFLYFQLVNFVVSNCDVISQWMLLWLIKARSLINYFKLFSKSKIFPNSFYFINSFIFSLYKHEERVKKLLSTEWKWLCLLCGSVCVGVGNVIHLHIFKKKAQIIWFLFLLLNHVHFVQCIYVCINGI